MLQPLAPNRGRVQTSREARFPAPLRGWNAKDITSAMRPEDAILLDDWVVIDGGVTLRKGRAEHVTGLGAAIVSLMAYTPPSGSEKLFAATGSSIFDVSTVGAVGAASITGLSNGRWQHTRFANASGTYLYIVNGADAPRYYNGSTWTTPTISGVTATNLISVTQHMERLWFIEKNTMKVWYLPALAIAGTATSIDFGGLSRFGGHLVAMISWSRDGGSGLDDVAAFVTSQGEVHIYSGSDPSSADTWARIGTFRIPEPIGYRCVMKAGPDAAILTRRGVVSLATVLGQTDSVQARGGITDNIVNAFAAAAESSGSVDGWQLIEGPTDRLIVVNAPLASGTRYEQYVMNSVTGGWSRFTGHRIAGCWEVFGKQLYFGGTDGTVYQYAGTTDAGEAVTGRIIHAYQTFGGMSAKNCRRVRPEIYAPSGTKPNLRMYYDYTLNLPQIAVPSSDVDGENWDEAEWDVAPWMPGFKVSRAWYGVKGSGFACALGLVVRSKNEVTYSGATLVHERGHML